MLSENGLHELAYRVMNQRSQPGYGWWLDQGATTTWEEWNGNGSHNHPMFGGGISWFYRHIAGMNPDPDKPGYKHIIFKPVPAGDLTSAAYTNNTPYGTAAISWKSGKNSFLMDLTVPVGSAATIYIPATSAKNVTENGRKIKNNRNIVFSHMEPGYAVFNIKSGEYSFNSTDRP